MCKTLWKEINEQSEEKVDFIYATVVHAYSLIYRKIPLQSTDRKTDNLLWQVLEEKEDNFKLFSLMMIAWTAHDVCAKFNNEILNTVEKLPGKRLKTEKENRN